MSTIVARSRIGNSDFLMVARSFLEDRNLPAASMLPAVEIENIFRRHDALFGNTYNAVYSTAVVLWAFLSQCLSDGKLRSCSTAVTRVFGYCLGIGAKPPSSDTGAYCVARKKLPEKAIRELVAMTAEKTLHLADDQWLWHERHVKLVDGFTATMPDTAENQAEFPQSAQQKPGVGFPILRAIVIVSLATACIHAAAVGPCTGKGTSENALLREILDTFLSGDVALLDRFYCSYMMVFLLSLRGVDSCSRLHASRPHDLRRGRRLGRYDRLVTWHRPARPPWMDKSTYATIPETMTLRMIRFNIVVPGRRTRQITVVTTLLDPKEYTAGDIAELYGYRWHVELDIRHIKQTLNLDHLRCKTPEMVRKEFFMTLLAYNLVRRTICVASLRHGRIPRRISFTQTCVIILTIPPLLLFSSGCSQITLETLFHRIAKLEIPDRPGRIEPRMIKRRPKNFPRMQEPRKIIKQRLERQTRCSKTT